MLIKKNTLGNITLRKKLSYKIPKNQELLYFYGYPVKWDILFLCWFSPRTKGDSFLGKWEKWITLRVTFLKAVRMQSSVWRMSINKYVTINLLPYLHESPRGTININLRRMRTRQDSRLKTHKA